MPDDVEILFADPDNVVARCGRMLLQYRRGALTLEVIDRIEHGYFRSTWIVMDLLRTGLGREGVTVVGPETPRLYGGHRERAR